MVADWLLPLVPAVAGGLSRQAALLTARLSRQSERASDFAGPDATRRAHDQAELMAMELLERENYPYRDLTVSSTCLDDVKINRR